LRPQNIKNYSVWTREYVGARTIKEMEFTM
jgi:hypothetical protein